MTSSLLTLLLLLPLAYGWTSQRNVVVRSPSFVGGIASKLSVKESGEMDMDNASSVTEMGNGNPCWEDFYDDDCVMTNAASAAFIAAEWIKGMPCAKGMEVSLHYR